MVKRLRQWWKWHKYKKTDWPFRYTGESLSFIEHGIVLQPAPGPKGAPGAKRYLSPDNLIRLLHDKDVEKR